VMFIEFLWWVSLVAETSRRLEATSRRGGPGGSGDGPSRVHKCPRNVHERFKFGCQRTTPLNTPIREAPAQVPFFNRGQHRSDALGRTCNHEVASSILAPGSRKDQLSATF
jgi:hypothetical protein